MSTVILQEEWMRSLDRKEQSMLMSIDLSSTFDMVNHNLMLEKLEIYGVGEEMREWIGIYLKIGLSISRFWTNKVNMFG